MAEAPPAILKIKKAIPDEFGTAFVFFQIKLFASLYAYPEMDAVFFKDTSLSTHPSNKLIIRVPYCAFFSEWVT